MERYDVIFTPDAESDSDEIFDYTAAKLCVPDTATKQATRIYNAIHSLSSMPKRCPLSRNAFLARQGFRVMQIDNYLVFFVVEEKAKRVIIHRIVYAKRQYAKLFYPDANT